MVRGQIFVFNQIEDGICGGQCTTTTGVFLEYGLLGFKSFSEFRYDRLRLVFILGIEMEIPVEAFEKIFRTRDPSLGKLGADYPPLGNETLNDPYRQGPVDVALETSSGPVKSQS